MGTPKRQLADHKERRDRLTGSKNKTKRKRLNQKIRKLEVDAPESPTDIMELARLTHERLRLPLDKSKFKEDKLYFNHKLPLFMKKYIKLLKTYHNIKPDIKPDIINLHKKFLDEVSSHAHSRDTAKITLINKMLLLLMSMIHISYKIKKLDIDGKSADEYVSPADMAQTLQQPSTASHTIVNPMYAGPGTDADEV